MDKSNLDENMTFEPSKPDLLALRLEINDQRIKALTAKIQFLTQVKGTHVKNAN